MRIRIIDAFTDRPFAGNPAGVCLLEAGSWPDPEWMRRIAAELGHETAFARPTPDGAGADSALRWFTAAAESNVCGHAALATAHALHTDRGTPLTVRFSSQFGILIARAGPYWSQRLGRDSLIGLQASDRTGLVHTAVHGDRVHLTGHAVTVLDGTLDRNAR